ncbi:MAG: hypothetical protein IJX34_03625 [Clostridia bacterium]|nr:hypothetical protein [Clostridia bacterium]
MNLNETVLNYIENCEYNEPIFMEDIKLYIENFFYDKKKKLDNKKTYNNLKMIISRLNKENILKTATKGVYYKPKHNIFGEVPLANIKIIQYKYLVDKTGNKKGYLTGAILFNKVGLTTQVPNVTDIVTNNCKFNTKYTNTNLNVTIRKPKLEINNENYIYLQLFDLIENKDKINIEVENEDEILYNFITENKLNFEKIIKYARIINNKKIIEKILVLAR